MAMGMVGNSGRTTRLVAPNSPSDTVKANTAAESVARATIGQSTVNQTCRGAAPNEAAAWDAYHHQDLEDHETCAKKLGITVANSYKRVSRAQAYLRLYLQEQADD